MKEKELNIKAKQVTSNCFKLLCIVCREYLKNTDEIYSITCGHVFHKHCVLRWLKEYKYCPQCNQMSHELIARPLLLNFNEAPQLAVEGELKAIKTLKWRYLEGHVSIEEISKYGFQLGLDEKGDPIFAARVRFEHDLVPGYYIPKLKGIRFGWDYKSHFLSEKIEILHIDNDNADYKWVAAADAKAPENAVVAGYSEIGESLYFARNFYENSLRYGKLHPSHGGAYIIFKEEEIIILEGYEVLVRIPRDKEEKLCFS